MNLRYVLGTPTRGAPGAFYKLCWAPEVEEGALADFKVQIDGDFELVGPEPAELACHGHTGPIHRCAGRFSFKHHL